MADGTRRGGGPAWAWVLVGGCLAAGLAERRAAASARAAAAAAVTLPAPTDALPTPRGLRATDGVGASLAVDLARFLWSRRGTPGGGWGALEEVPGVGAALAGRLRGARAGLDSPDRP